MHVAIVGGTGLLGQPIARALLDTGYKVTIVTRNAAKAAETMGKGFKYAEAAIDDMTSLQQAFHSVDAVHINLSGYTPTQCDQIIHQGTANIVGAAQCTGVQLISMITGTTVCEANTGLYEIKSKLAAENIIKGSGIPYVIFCPSWFMESLPNFINNGRANIFGPGSIPIHWMAVDDYVKQFLRAYATPEVRDKRLILHGPTAISLLSALTTYVEIMEPDLNTNHSPYWLGTLLTWVTGDKSIRHAAKLCAYYECVGDLGDPTETNELVGAPKIELTDWCLRRSMEQTPQVQDNAEGGTNKKTA